MNNFIGTGEFEYVADAATRKMLHNAFMAISQTNMWDYIAKENYSFMMDTSYEINLINAKMFELEDVGHSGCSYGWTMRMMQKLAIMGEEKFTPFNLSIADLCNLKSPLAISRLIKGNLSVIK